MCFYDDGEHASVWIQSEPTARKEHRCCECKGAIAKGQKYLKVNYVFDGSAGTFKVCKSCEDVREEIARVEKSRGCHGSESICPIGELRDAIHEDSEHYGLIRVGPDKATFTEDGWEPYEGDYTGVAPIAAHLFPDLPVVFMPTTEVSR